MTRINLIPPKELMDQHLLAEWREIKMIPASLRRSLRTKSIIDVLRSIPDNYVLGTGHVKYFFDKHTYLRNRYIELTNELISRNFKLYHTGDFLDFCQNLPSEFFNDYTPTSEDYVLIRKRIKEKINMRPNWYRYHGEYIG
jgi:deoxyribonuclease (pyrimidine dimer)